MPSVIDILSSPPQFTTDEIARVCERFHDKAKHGQYVGLFRGVGRLHDRAIPYDAFTFLDQRGEPAVILAKFLDGRFMVVMEGETISEGRSLDAVLNAV